MFGVLAVIILVSIVVFGLRRLALREDPWLAVAPDPNCHGVITTKPNYKKDGKIVGQGGVITDVVHAIPGKKLVKPSKDPMDWHYVDGRESRGLLFILMGLLIIWFFRYPKMYSVRNFRLGRADEQAAYTVQPKASHTRFPYFSTEHDIELKGVETKQIIAFNIRLGFVLEEMYPIRVRERTADAYATFTKFASEHIISMIGAVDPIEFISGENKDKGGREIDDLKRKIVDSFTNDETLRDRILEETGLFIRKANMYDFDFDAETKELLESKTRFTINAENEVIKANGERDAKKARLEADAKEVTDVIIPLSESPLRVAARGMLSLERLDKLQTLVLGGGATPVIPIGGEGLNSTKKEVGVDK